MKASKQPGRKRKCKKCGVIKVLSEKYYRTHNSGGFLHICIGCFTPLKVLGCVKKEVFSTRKVVRPSRTILCKLVSELGYSTVGRKYGVSDNAVRKWLR
jgi:hypothetical protein